MKVWGMAAAVVLAMTLAGCGTDDASGGDQPEKPSGDWLTSTAPVATAPLVWESGGVVRLSDGTEVDLGGAPSSYVVAGDGVFFAEAEDSSQAETGSRASEEIWFAKPGADPEQTGLELRADTLRASPDGRFLAGIDVVSGEQDQYDTPVAQVVVLDLQEGREVLRSSDSMGDIATDDLADLYEDLEIGIAEMTDETVYVDSADGLIAVDLATGDVTDAGDVDVDVRMASDPQSPDGTWTIANTEDVKGEVTGTDGTEVPLDVAAPQWTLDWWADASTVVGVAIDGDSSSLMTCTVPDGTCTIDEASTGATVRYPTGSTDPLVIGLLG